MPTRFRELRNYTVRCPYQLNDDATSPAKKKITSSVRWLWVLFVTGEEVLTAEEHASTSFDALRWWCFAGHCRSHFFSFLRFTGSVDSSAVVLNNNNKIAFSLAASDTQPYCSWFYVVSFRSSGHFINKISPSIIFSLMPSTSHMCVLYRCVREVFTEQALPYVCRLVFPACSVIHVLFESDQCISFHWKSSLTNEDWSLRRRRSS